MESETIWLWKVGLEKQAFILRGGRGGRKGGGGRDDATVSHTIVSPTKHMATLSSRGK